MWDKDMGHVENLQLKKVLYFQCAVRGRYEDKITPMVILLGGSSGTR